MDVALRVAERFLLASRVAERTKQGDSIGDPKELLEQFRMYLKRYSEIEPLAHSLKSKYEQLFKLVEQHPEAADEQKALREQIPMRGDDSPITVSVTLKHYGFTKMQESARLLCLALFQQFSLPPKTRKALEAASKFWMRNPRLNPKGKSVEYMYAAAVDEYLEYLEDFRKYEKLFEHAMAEGKPHSDTGELVTKYRAGPFTVVNTGGFEAKLMQDKATLCEEAAKKMEGIGLGKVCYGDVLVSNRLSGDRIAAFYLPAKDEMFVRADAKVTLDTVRVMCHELTHRLDHKFLQSKKADIVALYRKINTHSSYLSDTEMPEYGEPLTYKGELWKVVEKDGRRHTVKLAPANPLRCFVCAEKGRPEHVPDEEHKFPISRKEVITMPAQTYYKLQGREQKVDPLEFITAYAKRGGPGENFAEMVSFYAIGQLPKEQVELLLPIIS